VDDGDADSRPFPSTVLFFHVDKYVLAVTPVPACRIFVKPRLMRICVLVGQVWSLEPRRGRDQQLRSSADAAGADQPEEDIGG